MNEIRIIGGKWRSRKIRLKSSDALRPTTSRIRETLFNWLQPFIQGAVCLDPYAGSGALGIEALSRGAAHVTFIDSNPAMIAQLQKNLAVLDDHQHSVACQSFPSQGAFQQPIDIVFLDPPYENDTTTLEGVLQFLSEEKMLSSQAILTIEAPRAVQLPCVKHYEIYRERTTKTIRYGLLKYAHSPA